MTTILINSLEDIQQAAKTFVNTIGTARHFAFYGSMGAGKTTFIKAICEELGVQEVITSPTFAIVNVYQAEKVDNTVYHFDFYRIKNISEVYDMGYEDYFYSNAYCFMEWPELVEEILPEDTCKVYIKVADNGERTVEIDQ